MAKATRDIKFARVVLFSKKHYLIEHNSYQPNFSSNLGAILSTRQRDQPCRCVSEVGLVLWVSMRERKVGGVKPLGLYCFSGFNEPFEHATGVEKWELIKKKEGNDVSYKYILPNAM